MAIITFMSDFGIDDHYVASVKAKILSLAPQQQIVDICHTIEPFDMAHAAFVLKGVFRDFPLGTVHLIAIDHAPKVPRPWVAARLEGHLFLGRDSGILSLISEFDPDEIVTLANDELISTFPERDFLAPLAVELCKKGNLQGFGKPYLEANRLIGRQVKATKKQMSGHVVRVDRYGNLITNLRHIDFIAINKINNDAGYTIRVGREVFHKVHQTFTDVDSGEIFVLFNSLGVLQIGINKGNASELLGLSFDSPIFIDFTVQPN